MNEWTCLLSSSLLHYSSSEAALTASAFHITGRFVLLALIKNHFESWVFFNNIQDIISYFAVENEKIRFEA